MSVTRRHIEDVIFFLRAAQGPIEPRAREYQIAAAIRDLEHMLTLVPVSVLPETVSAGVTAHAHLAKASIELIQVKSALLGFKPAAADPELVEKMIHSVDFALSDLVEILKSEKRGQKCAR